VGAYAPTHTYFRHLFLPWVECYQYFFINSPFIRTKLRDCENFMNTRRKIIGSVQRAIDILDLFDEHHPEMGTTEIALALDLPKSTAAGLILTLDHNGYLEQNQATRKYRLGYKLAERAGLLLSQFDLRQIAAPALEALRNRCNESINLAIRDGAYVVYIERLYGTSMLGMRSEIGKRERVHSTALGKAILATLPESELKDFISKFNFIAVTPRTMTSPPEFISELQKTCQRGFAIDDEENELGGRCVAAPIFDYRGIAVAAVSISVPIQRFPREKIDDYGRWVKDTAGEISRKLGAARL
jgi:IclR family KDG regulon transcriptional repressor